MAKSIIKNDSVSFEQIGANIEEYIDSLSNAEEIRTGIQSSNMSLIKNLMAGFGAFVLYNNKQEREETYLSTAVLPSSVYEIASPFGYSINRSDAPIVRIRYMGIPTLTLFPGTILGTYEDLDVVYFGKSKKIEKLDLIEVYVGRYQELETLSELIDSIYILEIQPIELEAVSRDAIQLSVNDVPQTISRDIEDYIITRDIVDYSPSPYSSKLFITDADNLYGIPLDSGQRIKVQWLETNGRDTALQLQNVKLDEDYLAVELGSLGTSGDSLEKIKQLAPLLFSTMRRMVTARDHKFITETHPLINSASAFKDPGVPMRLRVTPTANPESDYTFTLMGVVHSIPPEVSRTLDTLVSQIYISILDTNPYVYVERQEDYVIISGKSATESTQGYIFPPTHFSVVILDAFKKPGCCTVVINYVHSNTTSAPYPLKFIEQQLLVDHLDRYKMVGVTLILTPAKANYQTFKVRLKLVDPDYYNAVKEKIDKILSEYELVLGKDFDYGVALVKISNIELILDSDAGAVKPVLSVVPDQEVYDVEGSVDQYLKFNTIEAFLE